MVAPVPPGMALKADAPATDWETVDRWDGGAGWIAHPGERMQRASHALVGDDGGVWVVDPVDVPGLDDLLAEFGTVAGIVVGLGRHKRDAAAVADRHDVPVYVPSIMAGVAADLAAPTELFEGRLGESGYRARPVVDNPFWKEVALVDEAGDVLLVPEAVGTAPYYRARGERLGVHPMLRLFPPRTLRDFEPARVLVGHGAGIDEDAPAALRAAIDGARRNAGAVWWNGLRGMLPV